MRFDFLIAKLKRTMGKPQPTVTLATSLRSGSSPANRQSFADPALALVTGETKTRKRRRAG